ncbi:hypothetical protein [Sphingobium yanoikuyae]|uniref:hypothetical protein n=1 Tax=Sphingobium yanoikuyae TaxID=13690 RepID=UPI0028AD5398|nr:hypothetical protein [Sphingobium yanoikuyae]
MIANFSSIGRENGFRMGDFRGLFSEYGKRATRNIGWRCRFCDICRHSGTVKDDEDLYL